MSSTMTVQAETRRSKRREAAGAVSLLGPATLLLLVMLVAPLAIMAATA